MDADKNGAFANGWVTPTGISAFLTGSPTATRICRSAAGCSRPPDTARLDGMTKVIASEKLTATALGAARYGASISYKPVALTTIAAGATGASGMTESKAPAKTAEKKTEEKAPEKKSGGSKFGLGGLSSLGKEKSSNQTVSSAGTRGVNPDRDAKGGGNPALVTVPLTPAEIEAFRKGIV